MAEEHKNDNHPQHHLVDELKEAVHKLRHHEDSHKKSTWTKLREFIEKAGVAKELSKVMSSVAKSIETLSETPNKMLEKMPPAKNIEEAIALQNATTANMTKISNSITKDVKELIEVFSDKILALAGEITNELADKPKEFVTESAQAVGTESVKNLKQFTEMEQVLLSAAIILQKTGMDGLLEGEKIAFKGLEKETEALNRVDKDTLDHVNQLTKMISKLIKMPVGDERSFALEEFEQQFIKLQNRLKHEDRFLKDLQKEEGFDSADKSEKSKFASGVTKNDHKSIIESKNNPDSKDKNKKVNSI